MIDAEKNNALGTEISAWQIVTNFSTKVSQSNEIL